MKNSLRPDKIDVFDLSNLVLERLNCNRKFKLSHYDFELKFRRDINFPSDKFNINLVLFKQDIAVTYYTTTYNTVHKICNLLFVHLIDDGGYDTIEDAILAAKRRHLDDMLQETIREINAIMDTNHVGNFSVFIDEQFPYKRVDDKGLPIFELNIYSEERNIDLKIELNNNYCGFNEKSIILDRLVSKFKQT